MRVGVIDPRAVKATRIDPFVPTKPDVPETVRARFPDSAHVVVGPSHALGFTWREPEGWTPYLCDLRDDAPASVLESVPPNRELAHRCVFDDDQAYLATANFVRRVNLETREVENLVVGGVIRSAYPVSDDEGARYVVVDCDAEGFTIREDEAETVRAGALMTGGGDVGDFFSPRGGQMLLDAESGEVVANVAFDCRSLRAHRVGGRDVLVLRRFGRRDAWQTLVLRVQRDRFELVAALHEDVGATQVEGDRILGSAGFALSGFAATQGEVPEDPKPMRRVRRSTHHDPPLHLDADLLEAALPRRDRGHTVRPLHQPREGLAALHVYLCKATTSPHETFETDAAGRSAFERVWTVFAPRTIAPPPDPEVLGAALAIAKSNEAWVERLLAWYAEQRGVVDALRAVLECWRYRAPGVTTLRGFTRPGFPERMDNSLRYHVFFAQPGTAQWRRARYLVLRHALSTCDEASYEEAKALATETYAGAPSLVRVCLAALFPEKGWADDLANDWLEGACDRLEHVPFAPLLAAVSDPALAARLAAAITSPVVQVHVPDLVTNLGADAVDALAAIRDVALDTKYGGLQMAERVIDALCCIYTTEAAAALAPFYAEAKLERRLTKHFEKHAEWALEGLASFRKGKGSGRARAARKVIEKDHPQLAAKAKAKENAKKASKTRAKASPGTNPKPGGKPAKAKPAKAKPAKAKPAKAKPAKASAKPKPSTSNATSKTTAELPPSLRALRDPDRPLAWPADQTLPVWRRAHRDRLPPLSLDAAADHARVADAFARHRHLFEKSRAKHDDAWLAPQEAAWTGDPDTVLGAEVLGDALALFHHVGWTKDYTRSAEVARLAEHHGGAPLLFEACHHAWTRRTGTDTDQYSGTVRAIWLEDWPDAKGALADSFQPRPHGRLHPALPNPWVDLRRALLRADDDTYARAHALAAKAREEGSLDLRAAIAFAFEDDAWRRQSVDETEAATKSGYPAYGVYFYLTADGDLLERVHARATLDMHSHHCGYADAPVHTQRRLLRDVVGYHGAAATPILEHQIELVTRPEEPWNDEQQKLYETIALLQTPDAFGLLAPILSIGRPEAWELLAAYALRSTGENIVAAIARKGGLDPEVRPLVALGLSTNHDTWRAAIDALEQGDLKAELLAIADAFGPAAPATPPKPFRPAKLKEPKAARPYDDPLLLPRPLLKDRTQLPPESLPRLITPLRKLSDPKKRKTAEALRELLDPDSARELGRALVEAWQDAGSHKRGDWTREACVFLGGPATPKPRRRQRRVRTWWP